MKADDKEKNLKRKEEFLLALRESLGVVYGACKRTGVPRALYVKWLSEDRDFAEEAGAISEIALDYVESKALEEIRSGNARLIQFYLQTKGRSRGYGKSEPRDDKQQVVLLTQDEAEY